MSHTLRRHVTALAIAGAALLGCVGTASAADTIAAATPLPLDAATPVQLIGAPVAAQYWTLELGLSQRIRIDINQPLSEAVTINVFRPGVTDATIGAAKPAYSGTAVSTITPKQGAFFADTPGTWIVQATSAQPTTFTMTARQLKAATPNPITKPTATVLNAPTLVVGRLYSTSTYNASQAGLVSPRIVHLAANQGDRVKLDIAVTNRRGLKLEVFEPGITDGSIGTATPVVSVDAPINDAATTVTFTARITGAYIVRATSTAVAPATIVRPTTFTAHLVDVAPPDLQEPCAQDVTNIGRTRVKGCLEAGPNGTYVATEPVTMSGVILEPVGKATMVINPRTLEVTSAGEFSVVIWSIRLPASNYFEFSGTRELNLLDPAKNQDGTERDPTKTGDDQEGDARGLTWSDVNDGRSDIDGPSVGGLPLTGRIALAWSLDNGGQASVTANANIPGWGVTGALSFAVSNDNGLESAQVAFGSGSTTGITFNAMLSYQEVLENDLRIDVWSSAFKADVGTKVPPATLTGGEGELEIRDGVLSYVRFGVRTSIPVGATGIVVTKLGASLRWRPYFALTGSGSVAAGPAVGGVSVVEISGEGGFANGGSCPGSTAVGDRWFFDGSAAIAKWFTVANFGICYQGADRPFIHAHTSAGFSAAGVLEGRANLAGYIDGSRAMMIEGNANLKVYGFSAGGTLVLSDYGLAACGYGDIRVFGIKRRIAVGYERRWDDASATGTFACPEFAPYRTVGLGRSARAADGWPLVVPAANTQIDIRVTGVGGAVPSVELVDPDGTVLGRSGSLTENSIDNALFIPRPAAGEMLVAAPLAKAGTYRIRAQAGSQIATVQTSLPLPDVTIDAKVKRTRARSTLSYRLGNLAGRRVEFWVVGDGVARRLGTAGSTSGSIAYRETASLGGARRIMATVLNADGIGGPRTTVARYSIRRLTAPAKPHGITSTRAGRSLTLRWQPVANAISYRVRLADSDGHRYDTIVRRPAYTLRATRGDVVFVEVNALGYGELQSKTARAELRG